MLKKGRVRIYRVGPDGRPLPGHSVENKHVDAVPVPGKFFGA
jgi:hypothetical protein